MIRRAAGPLAIVLLLSCAETTVEPSATTATATTVAFEVAESRQEVLDQLDVELSALSERIIEGDGQAQALERIEALWIALQAELEADRPELVPGFQVVIDLARSAVARRRPADADKARLNLTALLTAAQELTTPQLCVRTNASRPL